MREIELIAIHCAATPNGKPFTVEDIDRWHAERGFRRDPKLIGYNQPALKSIGYHYVIYVAGATAMGRGLEEIGAHAAGHNAHSIGVCLIGTDKFSFDQWTTLRKNVCATVATLARRRGLPHAPKYPIAPREAVALAREMGVRIVGHRDLPNVHKECPGFSVADWLTGGMEPLAGHIIEEAY
jgi:hypothetical protein